MPITIPDAIVNYGDFYAIDGTWVDPATQEDLNTLLKPVIAWLKDFIVVYANPTDNRATIDWRLLRDEILPDANDWVDAQLIGKYAVPLRKTRAGGTHYHRTIVEAASLFVAHRIVTRTYAAGAMPNDSPYADKLAEWRDSRMADLKATRLRGQFLKTRGRFVDPNVEEFDAPGPGATSGKTNFQAPKE